MIDSKALLADLQEQVRLLEADLAEQLETVPGLVDVLRDEHAAERKARRTAAEWPQWRGAQLTQIAVAWVLGTVFLRWTEDNGLIDPVLSGPGDRRAVAEDAQLEHYRRHPEHNDGDWLAEQFEVLRATDAGRLLFDPEHNPMYWVPISHDAAKALVTFWRARRPDGALRHDFTDPDVGHPLPRRPVPGPVGGTRRRPTRCCRPRSSSRSSSSTARSTPAIEEFGLDETAADRPGLRLAATSCWARSSGCSTSWRRAEPATGRCELAPRALDAVHGVDINPFAVAIARFRLLVAALKAAASSDLADAPGFPLQLGGRRLDSLHVPPERQGSCAGGRRRRSVPHPAARTWTTSTTRRRSPRPTYHVVVGNPPYITVKDPALNEAYRERYAPATASTRSPFRSRERFFDLARRPRRRARRGLRRADHVQLVHEARVRQEADRGLLPDGRPDARHRHVRRLHPRPRNADGDPRRAAGVPSRRDAVRAVLGVRGGARRSPTTRRRAWSGRRSPLRSSTRGASRSG